MNTREEHEMDLLTVKETADLLRVAPITVRRHIASGRLPALRIGRAIRIEREAVERVITLTGERPPQDEDVILEGESTHADDPFWEIAGIANSAESEATDSTENHDQDLEGRPFTRDDSLWNLVGIFESGPDDPTDVSENHDKYLAEAYADTHE